MPVIEVRQLTKRFGGNVLAVDHLDFAVDAGTVCGLLGPNGAGKTTALRMLVGLIRPTSGEARVFDTRVTASDKVLRRVGAMIEHAAFYPYLSGVSNLRIYWEQGGGSWPPANLDDALAVAGLGDAVNRRVKTYSHGMKQRLGICRVLLGDPEILMLDEPTNGLDPGEIREIRRLMQRLADRGTTVLLSSHLLGEIEQTCSHVVVMDRGHLVAAGTVDSFVAGTKWVYFEVDDTARATQVLDAHPGVVAVSPEHPGLTVELDGAPRAELVAALVREGVAVDTVMARNRLEDAFLGLLRDDGAGSVLPEEPR
jgi:ABC-2 type transport system ATP-binding protein